MTSRRITEDLSRWANQTVRVLFAHTDNRGPLRASVDDMRFAPRAVDGIPLHSRARHLMGFPLARWGCVLSAVALLLVTSVGCGSDHSASSTDALSKRSGAKSVASPTTLPRTHGVVVMDDFESGSLTGWRAVGGGSALGEHPYEKSR